MESSPATPESTSDVAPIQTVVDHYVEGVRTGDVDRMKKAFSSDAIMSGYLGDEHMIIPIEAFYGLVADTPPPSETGEDYHAEIRTIEVEERVAAVEIAESALMGFNFTTHFHLMKGEGRWQIVSKLFETVGKSA